MLGRRCFVLFVFLLVLVVMDRGIGSVFQYFYNTSRYGIFGRQVYCMSRSDEDIIILGPSTASHNYVPSILADSLGASCFNAGSDGMSVYYHYGVLSSYKGSRKPQLIIYDLNRLDWCKSNSSTFTLDAALDRLSPHYGLTPEIDTLFALNGWREKIKQLSLQYRYNSKLVQLIKCHWMSSHEDNGYEALGGVMPLGAVMEILEGGGEVENEKVSYIQKLIDYIRINQIQLVMVVSPRYYRLSNYEFKVGREIAEKNGIPFIDMFNAPEMMNPKYFADENHLNDTGARVFSQLLTDSIRVILSRRMVSEGI